MALIPRFRTQSTRRAVPILACTVTLACSSLVNAQELLWSDEFDSGNQPNEDVWTYDIGRGPFNDGWGNGELQEYTNLQENIRIEDGKLIITAIAKDPLPAQPPGFTSARIKTQDKLTFRYGRIEARINVPDLERGLWPAFWTLGNGFDGFNWPSIGEIDIMEMGFSNVFGTPGRVNRKVGSHAYWDDDGVWPPADFGGDLEVDTPLNGEFHVFALDWTPSSITTYLDGQQIWSMDISDPNWDGYQEFHQPHFMLLNMAVGGGVTSLVSNTQVTAPLPASMEVDWVRIYDNGFTELEGTALGSPDIGPAHSGSWYNAAQRGHGFSMEFSETDTGPIAAIYWYTYDGEGNAIFMLGLGVPDGNRVEVTFYAYSGMVYGTFDPATNTEFVGGTGVFEFSDRDNATFSYTPSQEMGDTYGHVGGVDQLPLVKLLGIDAATQFQSSGQ